MKLATYKDGSRDGQLVVVSRDLGLAHFATGSATRLQQALDDWNFIAPQLQDLYVTLNHGKARHAFAFDARQCMAPLPRAYQHATGAAYPQHQALLRRAADTAPPDTHPTSVWLAQRGSDDFLGPTDDAWFGAEAWGIDFAAQLAVITGDVDMGASPAQALDGVRLLLLANAWTLHHLVAAELVADPGMGLLQSQPTTTFSPVAVTPDELGDAWRGGRLHATLQTSLNGKRVGLGDTGPAMHTHFGQLISHLAKTRNVRAGSIVSTGPISHADPAQGWHNLADKRANEALQNGAPKTGTLRFGDTLRMDLKGKDGLSVFGEIKQRVTGPGMAEERAPDDAPLAAAEPAAPGANSAAGSTAANPATNPAAAADD